MSATRRELLLLDPERARRLERAYRLDGRPRWPWWSRARRRMSLAVASAAAALVVATVIAARLASGALGF